MFATKTNKTKSIVTIAASLVAGALLLAGSGLADANDKGRRSHDAQPRLVEGSGAGIRQEGTQKDRDRHEDKDRKHKDKKHKHKHKDKDKCGDEKKCPTPAPVTIIHGGQPPISPPASGSDPKSGYPLAPVLGDPGYSGRPPSSGGGAASPTGAPSRNPIQNGGSTIKQN